MANLVALAPQATTSPIGATRAAVYVKKTWSGAWRRSIYLQPVSAVWAAWPTRSTAQFVLQIGDILRAGASFFAFRKYKHSGYYGIHDYYVAIQVLPEAGDPYCIWCGWIPAQEFELEGGKTVGGSPVWSARATMTAYSLDTMLERRAVRGAWFRADSESDDDPLYMDRQPTFNRRLHTGQQLLGNRSLLQLLGDGDPIGVYVFGQSETWSHRQIIEYLLHYSQVNLFPGTEPDFVLGGAAEMTEHLDNVYEVVPHDGRSVHRMVSRLIDRRRGLGLVPRFSIESGGGPNEGLPVGDVELFVHSLVDAPASVGDKQLPANTDTVSLDFEDDIRVDRSRLVHDTLARYEKIIVQGEPMRTCFSVGVPKDPEDLTAYNYNLLIAEPAWAAAQETAYKAVDDAGRQSDRFARVYRAFRIPQTFHWRNEVLQHPDESLLPSFDIDGHIRFHMPSNIWPACKGLLRELPFVEHADTAAESQEPRYVEPFVVLEKLDASGEPTGDWVYAHVRPPEDAPDQYTAAQITPGDREMMFEVKFPTNHVLARNHFNRDDAGTVTSPVKPMFDFNRMIATLAVETDTHPSVEMLILHAPTTQSFRRTLTINVPDAHVWIVAPGTVTGIDADMQLRLHAGSRILRDDTDRLRQIAAVLKSYYSKARSALEVTYHGLQMLPPVGSMVETARMYGADEPIGTVVTEHVWNFTKGTSTLKTGHIELDAVRI